MAAGSEQRSVSECTSDISKRKRQNLLSSRDVRKFGRLKQNNKIAELEQQVQDLESQLKTSRTQ
eukprot:3325254-Karenia_brevis.AAC.1